jgi:Delta14-sterol reductase
MIFGLPILVYLSIFLCNDVAGCPAPSLLHPKSITLARLKAETPWPEQGWSGLIDLEVTGWVLAYYGLSLALQLLLPGTKSTGAKLDCGGRHQFKFNSFTSAILILTGCAIGTLMQGASFPVWTFIWDKLPQIVTANLIFSVAIAVYVYLLSFTVPHPGQPNPKHRELAKGGHSGNMVYDFFIGRELNPRLDIPSSIPLIGGQSLDIKVFCELRPGMLGWILLDLAFIAHQYRQYGMISDSIMLVTAFQTLYVLDALYMEPSILTTIDVTTDGFGFMLSFGDLVWLPFIYSLHCRYLAVHPVHLGPAGIAAILAVQGLGFYIFRSSNNEKNRFRTNPNDPRVSHLESISTASGSRLLTSGWWGRARHINYLGDWIMSWSYSLPTGLAGYFILSSPTTATKQTVQPAEVRGWGVLFTYFYVVYFAVLLIHRERRDEEKCKRKYGADWDRYTAKVKSRILPGIY